MSRTNGGEWKSKYEEKAPNFSGLPKWQPRPEPAPPPPPDIRIECQSCHERHRYTRQYWLPIVIFAVFITVWRWESYVYCPKCMRWRVVLYLIPSMLIATVAFPFVLVTWLWVFFQTFSKRPPVVYPD